MLSLCTAELHVTFNNVKIVNVAKKFVCGEFTLPAITKCTMVRIELRNVPWFI
jgi:hypothetical protein